VFPVVITTLRGSIVSNAVVLGILGSRLEISSKENIYTTAKHQTRNYYDKPKNMHTIHNDYIELMLPLHVSVVNIIHHCE
jgi:hypothetical protein